MLSFVISPGRKEQQVKVNCEKLCHGKISHFKHQQLNQEEVNLSYNFSRFVNSQVTMYLKLSVVAILCLTFVVIHCENSTKSASSSSSSLTNNSNGHTSPLEATSRHFSPSELNLNLPLESTFVTFNESSTHLHPPRSSPVRRFIPLPPTGRLNKPVYLNEWWKGPKPNLNKVTTAPYSVIRSLVPPKFEKRQDYYHDPRAFEPLEGIFSPHGSMLDRNSDFYYILPILLVIGLGSFLIPIISTFFTAMITSGGLSGCCRRRRINEKTTLDLAERVNSLWDSLEKSISKYSKTFSSIASDLDLKPNS